VKEKEKLLQIEVGKSGLDGRNVDRSAVDYRRGRAFDGAGRSDPPPWGLTPYSRNPRITTHAVQD